MEEINQMIESTNLRAGATKKDIVKLCEDAIRYNFYSVCVAPHYVGFVKELLEETKVLVTTVIGFPLGFQTMDTKIKEVDQAIQDGALELDVVLNIGALKDKDYEYVEREIQEVMAHAKGNVIKVIIETALLTEEEMKQAIDICNRTFVHFVKTCTGYGPRGVTVDDVTFINRYCNEILEIKASGGIDHYSKALELIDAGATRIGTSYGVQIMEEFLKGDECHHEVI